MVTIPGEWDATLQRRAPLGQQLVAVALLLSDAADPNDVDHAIPTLSQGLRSTVRQSPAGWCSSNNPGVLRKVRSQSSR